MRFLARASAPSITSQRPDRRVNRPPRKKLFREKKRYARRAGKSEKSVRVLGWSGRPLRRGVSMGAKAFLTRFPIKLPPCVVCALAFKGAWAPP